jgi:hypothetical protein
MQSKRSHPNVNSKKTYLMRSRHMTAKSGAIGHKLCDSLWAALAISTPQAVDEYQETSNSDFHKIAYAHVRHLALVEP